MAKALVAVGLAANIFQFIDIGSRFIPTAWYICTSGRQGLAELLDIQKTTEDLEECSTWYSEFERNGCHSGQ